MIDQSDETKKEMTPVVSGHISRAQAAEVETQAADRAAREFISAVFETKREHAIAVEQSILLLQESYELLRRVNRFSGEGSG